MQLIANHIQKSFEGKTVLRDVTYRFEKGTIYALLGRNGAGKTTLFRILSDQLKKDGGEVTYRREGQSAPLASRDVFMMVSEPELPGFLTGYEFLKFFIEANEKGLPERLPIEAYLDRIGLEEEDRYRLIQDYSTGMKNKLQMAMFLILQPPIILMDEPLTSLDVVVQLEMKQIIRSMRKDHIILFSTHILQLARDLCDELVLLHEGKLTSLDPDQMGAPDFEDKIIHLLSQKGEANEGENQGKVDALLVDPEDSTARTR